ncbi:hypothetical protein HAX54_046094 [Datura stramonium]|uniref:TF-B3 domain-containing protein n=1 Tax=Datura stramonium TaxID=4076 RepID=A0ABS8SR58_DATST|nr:hypothetical protein [Datura stramonium]
MLRDCSHSRLERKQLLRLSGNEETTNVERFVAGAAAGVTDCYCDVLTTGHSYSGLTGNEDSLFLKHGEKEFVDARSLVEGDLLIFKYHGNSQFDVLVFDKQSLCEKEASYFIKKCEHTDVASESRTKKPTRERNDPTSESSSSKQTSESSSHEEFETPATKKPKLVLTPTSSARANVDLRSREIKIPSEWARIHFPRTNLDVTLGVEENTWQANFIHAHHGVALNGGGWRNFILKNFLEKLDVCVINLVSGEDPNEIFDVSIFRAFE